MKRMALKTILSMKEIVILAISVFFGAIINFIFSQDQKTTKIFLLKLMASGFIGYVIVLIGIHFGWDMHFIGALCAMGGTCSDTLIRIIRKSIPKTIQNKFEKGDN